MRPGSAQEGLGGVETECSGEVTTEGCGESSGGDGQGEEKVIHILTETDLSGKDNLFLPCEAPAVSVRIFWRKARVCRRARCMVRE